MLSAKQVQANAETYMRQFFKVVDRKRTEVRWQSEWFGKFTLTDVIQLTSRFTIAQLMAREDFSNRYNSRRPITITELLYPLLQAYDSVVIQADAEFGGTDQKFNLLMGRDLQSMVGQRSQQCFMTPLLIGTDGSQKMSKSLGNYIGITEPPEEIYGKVMSIPDSLILQYFELVTDIPDEELEEFRQELNNEATNPMILKKRLAREIVTQLYNQESASKAEEHFAKVFQEREIPEEIAEYRLSFKNLRTIRDESVPEAAVYSLGKNPDIRRLLTEIGVAKSRSQASRLINQRAVEIDGIKVIDYTHPVQSGSIIKVGKHRFAKVINSDTK
jgi:tyrosyl-tRNA synthetase